MDTLAAFSLKIAKFCRITLFHIIGKHGRIVPVLLTKKMSTLIALLLNCRGEFVSAENDYLFALPGEGYQKVWSALKDTCKKLGDQIQQPDLIISTKIRNQKVPSLILTGKMLAEFNMLFKSVKIT